MSAGTSAWAPHTGGVAPPPGPPPPPGTPQTLPAPPQGMPTHGWTPPPGHNGPPAPQIPPRPPKLWLWALITAIVMVAAIVATAAITYAIARSAPNSTVASPSTPSEPTYTAAEQAAAKQAVCQAFDVSTAGSQSQGAARVNGEPNLPLLLRMLSSTVSVQDALEPAAPDDVAELAGRFVSTNLELMNAALGQADIAEVKRATDVSNDAVYALADACGLS